MEEDSINTIPLKASLYGGGSVSIVRSARDGNPAKHAEASVAVRVLLAVSELQRSGEFEREVGEHEVRQPDAPAAKGEARGT